MANKVSARIAALELSLDDLEAQIELLLAKTLPETVLGLEKIQQAKLQVALPYLVYDLIFIYLKTKGIDPKTHPVVAELDRIRKYFNKIKDAEDPAKRRLAVDKGVANRFIKHAIAQIKYSRPPGQDEGMPEENVRVPAKVTSKMVARSQYEKELKELGSEEEDDLEVIDDVHESSASPAPSSSKGKGKASAEDLLTDVAQTLAGQKRRRGAVDAFAGYGESEGEDRAKLARPSAEDADNPFEDSSRPGTPSTVKDSAKAPKPTKKTKRKTKQRQVESGL